MSEQMFDPIGEIPQDALDGVNHGQCQLLVRAFDIMADKCGTVSNATALWAIATLLAKIFAAASDNEGLQEETGRRFSAMLKTAYPAMVKAVETAKRQQEGRPKYDA